MSVTCVCWGVGWDSTAMLIELARRGQRPDLITFADVGGEKQGTYDFYPIFAEWLRDVGFPEPITCIYRPKPETTDRYREAVLDVAARLGIRIESERLDRLARLFGNMLANDTLPGIAFGASSCAMKWKVEAQEPT